MKTSKNIGNIFLSWRAKRGEKREIVGAIRRNANDGVRFQYLIKAKEAKEIGFSPYVDFPDLEKIYTENVLEIFAQRLTKSERPDIQHYYDFWEVDPELIHDKYYMLAHTQALLATDNFELLADYNPGKNLSFVSEICGLSHYKPDPNLITIGDVLKWEKDPSNQHDSKAIKLFKNDKLLGYLKTIHCNVFYKQDLTVVVKSIDKNGVLNRVFVKIISN